MASKDTRATRNNTKLFKKLNMVYGDFKRNTTKLIKAMGSSGKDWVYVPPESINKLYNIRKYKWSGRCVCTKHIKHMIYLKSLRDNKVYRIGNVCLRRIMPEVYDVVKIINDELKITAHPSDYCEVCEGKLKVFERDGKRLTTHIKCIPANEDRINNEKMLLLRTDTMRGFNNCKKCLGLVSKYSYCLRCNDDRPSKPCNKCSRKVYGSYDTCYTCSGCPNNNKPSDLCILCCRRRADRDNDLCLSCKELINDIDF